MKKIELLERRMLQIFNHGKGSCVNCDFDKAEFMRDPMVESAVHKAKLWQVSAVISALQEAGISVESFTAKVREKMGKGLYLEPETASFGNCFTVSQLLKIAETMISE